MDREKNKIWKKEQDEIKTSSRILNKDTDVSTCLEIQDSCRDDSGTYSITVQNFAGSRSLSIQVKVLDTPGAPEGPIHVTGVSADRCTEG